MVPKYYHFDVSAIAPCDRVINELEIDHLLYYRFARKIGSFDTIKYIIRNCSFNRLLHDKWTRVMSSNKIVVVLCTIHL